MPLQYRRRRTKHAPTGRFILQHHITKGGENHVEAVFALRPLRRHAARHRWLWRATQLGTIGHAPTASALTKCACCVLVTAYNYYHAY